MPSPLAPAMVYSLIGTLLVLLGKKLQLISLTHDLRQHHKVLWNSSLSCIDITTNLVKIARIFDKTSNHVATCFEHTWLSWYPLPMQVIHDNVGEFTGFASQQMLCLLNIKPILTMNKNPHANAICKQMQQTVATVLKKLLLANPPQSCYQATLLVDDALNLQCIPCNQRFQLHCKPCLEDLRSHMICFLRFLSLQIGEQSLNAESKWSMIFCFVPT